MCTCDTPRVRMRRRTSADAGPCGGVCHVCLCGDNRGGNLAGSTHPVDLLPGALYQNKETFITEGVDNLEELATAGAFNASPVRQVSVTSPASPAPCPHGAGVWYDKTATEWCSEMLKQRESPYVLMSSSKGAEGRPHGASNMASG